jgi:hypothetical protein
LLAAAASYESVLKYSYEAGRFWRTALANASSLPQEESEPNVKGHPPTVIVQVNDAAQVHDAVSQATQQPAPQPKDPYKGLTLVTETKVMETINPPMEAAA